MTRTSTTPCSATSAVVARISAFEPPSSKLRERDMTKHIRELAPAGIENVSRRGVLKGMLSTGGLVLAVTLLPSRLAAADAPKWGADGMPHGAVNNPLAFVSIAPDGTVTIVCHRSEMGQGIRTGMPLIVADGMEADWAKGKIAQATGDEFKYGNQATSGP